MDPDNKLHMATFAAVAGLLVYALVEIGAALFIVELPLADDWCREWAEREVGPDEYSEVCVEHKNAFEANKAWFNAEQAKRYKWLFGSALALGPPSGTAPSTSPRESEEGSSPERREGRAHRRGLPRRSRGDRAGHRLTRPRPVAPRRARTVPVGADRVRDGDATGPRVALTPGGDPLPASCSANGRSASAASAGPVHFGAGPAPRRSA